MFCDTSPEGCLADKRWSDNNAETTSPHPDCEEGYSAHLTVETVVGLVFVSKGQTGGRGSIVGL